MRQLFGTALLLLVYMTCHHPVVDDEDRMYRPTDHLYWQRAYPGVEFDVAAWRSQLEFLNLEYKRNKDARSTGEWVTQGPGNAGARINTVAVSPIDPQIILLGYSAGGIYRTDNGGTSWTPVFDDQAWLAIGDIVFDPEDPQVVYAGTGDPNISGIPFIGNGLYRSGDAGETWQHIGLEQVGIISEIIIDHSDNDVIYAATMGVPYFRSEDRGLYKSIDGGISWRKILFLGTGTGVIDIAQHPNDPQTLLAAGWDRIRNYEESTSSGVGARVHKSIDGGESWTMLEGGLPNAEHSRIGVEISSSNPDRMYAVYVDTDHELEDVYTSDDGGDHWSALPTKDGSGMGSRPFGGFGWYFGKIRLSPWDEHDLFLLGVRLWRWNSHLKQWSRVDQFTGDIVHPDKHDLVFESSDSFLLATDGGLYRSTDEAKTWRDVEDIPTTQFYRVAYNPHNPYLFYGGAQDNGSLKGSRESMLNWTQYFSGDGFRTLFHPEDSLIFYVETQYGGLFVTTNGGQSFEGATKGIDGTDFINWDAPVIMSQFDPDVLYYGTDRVYRSTSGTKEEFKPISGALTDEPILLDATSNLTVLLESPYNSKTLLAGSGDGNLYLTTDEGEQWEKIDAGLPDRYITSIRFSPTYDSTLFISHSGFKQGEKIPHIHRSDDLGTTWVSVDGNLPEIPINSVLVLPGNDDLVLFVGTDAGVYFTTDAGRFWFRLGNNMPIIPVFDLEYNPVQNLLIAGTHAKSIMTYDLSQEGLAGDINTRTVHHRVDHLVIWPNPARDFLHLHLDAAQITSISIIDGKGGVLETSPSDAGVVDISRLRPGYYFLKLELRDRIGVASFIKH